jgi:sulfatase maturation enzyme AslB (radical SAM superfamily)
MPRQARSLTTRSSAVMSPDPPILPLIALDTLWLQVTGTLCNIACRHCFITCGPKNRTHEMMSVEQVREALEQADQYGVREYYFTGGEPFLHPEIKTLIMMALKLGPLSILTNGILIDDAMAAWLGEIFRTSSYTLDLRVSLDGCTEQENDQIRGKGTFRRILTGIACLARHGLNPVITVTELHQKLHVNQERVAFVELLHSLGLDQPRLKFLPTFLLGREEQRTRPYREDELLHEGDLREGEEERLQCSSCRMVTANGVYPCPLLINVPGARMGATLQDGMRPVALAWQACYTCHLYGVTCRT